MKQKNKKGKAFGVGDDDLNFTFDVTHGKSVLAASLGEALLSHTPACHMQIVASQGSSAGSHMA